MSEDSAAVEDAFVVESICVEEDSAAVEKFAVAEDAFVVESFCAGEDSAGIEDFFGAEQISVSLEKFAVAEFPESKSSSSLIICRVPVFI